MNFDLNVVPFSRYGSYIAFSYLERTSERQAGLYMRTVRGCGAHAGVFHPIFRVELLREGKPAPFEEKATPSVLRLEAEGGRVEICIAESKLVRIRGMGAGLRLTMDTGKFENAIPAGERRWQVVKFAVNTKFMLTPIKGQLVVDAPWRVDKSGHVVADFLPDPDTGIFECAIEEFLSVWSEREYREDFEDCLSVVQREYLAWLDRMPEVPEVYFEAGELAAYINWSCVVAPEGHLTRPAMLMSKNWMNSVWSWDHCFNAWALSYKHPEAAWDQFMILFDNQDANGTLPDSVNDSVRRWSFCKPPIHGWALKRMMERTDFINVARLEEVYEPLCRWTQWWFDYRDDDGDGIPQYNHGNDSGWDNATVFEQGPPVESPDLSAFLVVQMDALAELARFLGKTREADAWEGRAKVLLHLMFSHAWRGGRFVAPQSGNHTVFDSASLMLYLPIMLGKRLPARVLSLLVAGLKEEGRFLTEHGLATESPQSPLYEADGYWRGPIWAPSTMIVVDGLAAAGEVEFARELARKFCDMAARSGMAENYDALTGTGLRDRAFTWTASVFLILAHEYLRR